MELLFNLVNLLFKDGAIWVGDVKLCLAREHNVELRALIAVTEEHFVFGHVCPCNCPDNFLHVRIIYLQLLKAGDLIDVL